MELCHDGSLETGFWVPGMQLTVILSTYNSPDWLEKVLWGYASQTHRDFELVIADDGSGDETRQRIEKLRQETNLPIRHVWHPDDGFQKSAILNQAETAGFTLLNAVPPSNLTNLTSHSLRTPHRSRNHG